MSSSTTSKEAFELHARAFKTIHKQCPQLFASIFTNAVFTAVTPYAGIYLSAKIINELAGSRRPQELWKLVIITVAVTSVLSLLTYITERWKEYAQAPVEYGVSKTYTSKMMDMDFSAFDEQSTHDLLSHIKQSQQFSGWGFYKSINYFEAVVKSMTGIVTAVGLSVSLFTMQVPQSAGSMTFLNSPLVSLLMLAALIAVTIISPALKNKANAAFASATEDMKESNRIFTFFGFICHEHPRALDTRIYNQQKISSPYFTHDHTFTKNFELTRTSKGVFGVCRALSVSVSMVFTGLVYVYVCLKAWAGAFGVGSVTQYIRSFTSLAGNLSSLAATIGDMKNNAVFLESSFKFLDIPNDMYQGSLTTEKRADRQYNVEFKDVSFKYPGSKIYALRHLSMKFKVGERLAVVGMNGSGKTTFIKLLCRLYDPTEGQILLNGIDIRKYNYDDYMSIFAVVFQDFKLLSFPLGQNVAAAQNYDREKVLDCLDKAGFAEKLAKMPNGTDTCLYKDFSQEGVEVSGGEAQKIAIARALYKDAPFIILDEPTAALDPVAEAEIYTKFNEIAGDKTAIYISHRLSSCRFCDEIAVFDNGQIVQQGSHDDLVADETGKYHELWYSQAQYYQNESADE